jgi:hypothetical protein
VSKKSTFWFLGLPLAALVIAGLWFLYACFVMPPWHGGLRAWVASMDIMAGRRRSESFWLGIRVHDSIRETDLSKMCREVLGDPPPPVWHVSSAERKLLSGARDMVQGDCVHAETAGNCMAGIIDGLFTRDAKKEVLTRFFDLLGQGEVQTSRGPRLGSDLAWEYASDVATFAVGWDQAEKHQIDVKDLPRFAPE